ncbi:MAG: diaminopimelate epimerase [Candidatus Woesearchaeota archaeon]
MKFTKMHGTGNDFVVINSLIEKLPSDMVSFSKKIADRKFGIGCDQVLIIAKSDVADFKMLIYNNDGSQVEMCGNGIRCFARYVFEKGLTEKKKILVETLAGIIIPEIINDLVKVDMGEPILEGKKIPVKIEKEKIINESISIGGKDFLFTAVSMGNPHCIIYSDLSDENVLKNGPLIEKHELFPNKVNVEFVNVIDKNSVEMRVWERGTGETLACGTGASAVGVACVLNNLTERNVSVKVKGGILNIIWDEKTNHVFMSGPAAFVFEGEYNFQS